MKDDSSKPDSLSSGLVNEGVVGTEIDSSKIYREGNKYYKNVNLFDTNKSM